LIQVIAATAVAACGGGNTSNPNPIQGVSPGGIWHGTDSASGLAVTGLVDETGFGEFTRADGALFQGQVSTSSSNSISVDADGYPAALNFPDGSQHGIWTVNGTIQARKSVNATTKFTTDNGTATQGTLDLTFDELYNQPSSLAAVAGGYVVDVGFTNIGLDGSISGHEPTIGDYSGRISVIDPAYNLYRIQLTLTADSGGVVFDMTGLATTDNTVGTQRLEIVGLATQYGATVPWVATWCTYIC
jgi:hypothetical protein